MTIYNLVSCCASATYPLPAMMPMAPVTHPMGFVPLLMAHLPCANVDDTSSIYAVLVIADLISYPFI